MNIVSSGTLRPEDLIPCFAAELSIRAGENTSPYHANLIDEALAFADFDSHEAEDLVDDLIAALDELAPEGFYFGAHEGDGACFGFWSASEENMVFSVQLTYYIKSGSADRALGTAQSAAKHLLETYNDDASIPRIYYTVESTENGIIYRNGVIDA